MSDAPKPPPRTTSGEAFRVQSAQRMQPLKEVAQPQGPISARLKEGAADTALNVVGILRDLWDDFRSSDQFFKFKALILAVWVVLSAGGFMVACPGGEGPSNTIGARLRRSMVLDSTVITLFNDSGEPWQDVVVEVNGKYRAAVSRVSAEYPDNTLTLESKKLLGDKGEPAPGDLLNRISKLRVRTSDGHADLVVDGKDVQ